MQVSKRQGEHHKNEKHWKRMLANIKLRLPGGDWGADLYLSDGSSPTPMSPNLQLHAAGGLEQIKMPVSPLYPC